jgi:alcohol dehydrogenase
VPAAAVVDPELTPGCAGERHGVLRHRRARARGRVVHRPAAAPRLVRAAPGVHRAQRPHRPDRLAGRGKLGPRPSGDRDARREVALGALLAGIAFGSTGTHLCPAIQYPIGALTKTPHGLGTGLLLPCALDVLRAEPDVAERIARLGAAVERIPERDASAEGDGRPRRRDQPGDRRARDARRDRHRA